jgi:tRNA pseudouridine38-40 synthase
VGEHDFAAFCRPREGATTIRRVLHLQWERQPDSVVTMTIVADAFCHSMVRAVVGCLLVVGDHRHEAHWPAEVLHSRQRHPQVAVAPAHGLVLVEVRYPPDEQLAQQQERTRVVRVLEADR